MAGKEPIRIQLTQEQREMVRKATGKNAEALELSAQELEERIAPMSALDTNLS
jgi:hypothetical protein